MNQIEKITKILEYGVALLNWGISNINNFPVWKNKGGETPSKTQ